MPYDACATAPFVIPAGSAGIAKTPADNWAAGTWTEITADSGAAALMLLHLIVAITSVGLSGQSVWEIGVGAPGAEAVIASWKLSLPWFTAGASYGNYPLALPVDLIPAHSRIAVLARGGPFYGYAPACAVLIGVQPTPAPLEIEVAPGPQKMMVQSGVMPTGTVNATEWAWSPWTELLASAPTDIVLSGFQLLFGQASVPGVFPVEVEFGVGAPGAEVPITSVMDTCSNAGSKGHWGTEPLAVLHAVSAGERVAARMRKIGTATLTGDWAAELSYFEVSA